MPLYYFALNGAPDDEDLEGDDLPDDGAALREAAKVLAEQLRLRADEIERIRSFSVRVLDAQRQPKVVVKAIVEDL